jgi:hypothetical protein
MPPKGCPGARVLAFGDHTEEDEDDNAPAAKSHLRQWPIKLRLAPHAAPFFAGATILLAADCAPFSYGAFHADFIKGKALLTACPKFGDNNAQIEKLTAILEANDVRGIEVVLMEVPCCFGLANVAATAIVNSGKDVSLVVTKLSLKGEVLQSGSIPTAAKR